MTQEEIRALIVEKAKAAGIDPNHALAMAGIESRLDPRAVNPAGTHKGIFQFGPGEWSTYGGGGDIFDPNAQVTAYIAYHNKIKDEMTRLLGREPTGAELYLGWQQGANGAANLILNPKTSASALVGNPAIAANAGKPGVTAADFVNQWAERYKQELAGLGATDPAPAAPTSGLLADTSDGGAAKAAADKAARDKEQEAAFAGMTKQGMGLLQQATPEPVRFMPGQVDIHAPQPSPPRLPNYREQAQPDYLQMLMQQALQRRT